MFSLPHIILDPHPIKLKSTKQPQDEQFALHQFHQSFPKGIKSVLYSH